MDTLSYQTPPTRSSRFRHYYLVCLAWTTVPYGVVLFFFVYAGNAFARLATSLGLALPWFSAQLTELVLLLRSPWTWPLAAIPLALLPLLPALLCERQRARGRPISALRYYRFLLLPLFCLAFALMAIGFGGPLFNLIHSVSSDP